MRKLKTLDISDNTAELSALACLVPQEDNLQRGCPELEFLNLWGMPCLDLELLKKIILCLPKLRCVKYELFIDEFIELANVPITKSTATCLEEIIEWGMDFIKFTYAPHCNNVLDNTAVATNFGDITSVDITVRKDSQTLMSDIMMSLTKLKNLTVHNLSNSQEVLLPFLDSSGILLEDKIR